MVYRFLNLFFPAKCAFCRKILPAQQTDLCHDCRSSAPVFTKSKKRFSFIAGWTAVWYYKDTVRQSLLRYKFYHNRSYAPFYGRMLAMKLREARLDDFDVLTWVPVSPLRKLRRGYDQSQLLAEAVAEELGVSAVACLKKVRHNRAQSSLQQAPQRRANVKNAYRVLSPEEFKDKTVLLLDDIVTTGATASECAQTLLTAGARQVYFAAVAVASDDQNHTDM